MYLTFGEYQALGGGLAEAGFTRAEFNARKRVDALTDGRLVGAGVIPETVCMLMFELIERGLLGDLDGADVQSASNDGLSASYESGAEKTSRADALIADYLGGETDANGTPLLYRGGLGWVS